MFETVGYEVSRLKRLSYGPFLLPEELAPGKSLQLSPAQAAQQMALL
jgi:16S rRNA U516 pseudouridylate synthase RsuA-like enzyme